MVYLIAIYVSGYLGAVIFLEQTDDENCWEKHAAIGVASFLWPILALAAIPWIVKKMIDKAKSAWRRNE